VHPYHEGVNHALPFGTLKFHFGGLLHGTASPNAGDTTEMHCLPNLGGSGAGTGVVTTHSEMLPLRVRGVPQKCLVHSELVECARMKARGPIEAEEARSRWSRLAKSPTVPTTHQFTELATQAVLRTLPAQAYHLIFQMAGLRAPPREIDTPAAMATRAAILRSTDTARLLRERQRHLSN
jgi:hypothetical protein